MFTKPSPGSGGSGGSSQRFFGAIGKVTATSGTCSVGAAAAGWCTGGTFVGSFTSGGMSSPGGIAIDSTNGFAYVTSSVMVQKFVLSTGAFVGSNGYVSATTGTCVVGQRGVNWCTGGSFTNNSGADGTFNQPSGIAVDPVGGYLYVTDSNDHKIAQMSLATGALVGMIGKNIFSTGTCPNGSVSPGWCTIGSGGSTTSGATDGAFGAFGSPTGLAIDTTNGFLYAVDPWNNRIQKFVLGTGVFVGSIGKTSGTVGSCPGANLAAPGWCTGGTFVSGAGDGMFTQPNDVALDIANNFMYVSDTGNNRVQKFVLSSGAFVGAIGSTSATSGTCPATGATNSWCTGGTFVSGAGDGMFSSPNGIKLDPALGLLYVEDAGNRIARINLSTGAFVGAIGNTTSSTGTCLASGVNSNWCTGGLFSTGAGDGMFNAGGVGLDLVNGNLFVVDTNNNRVQKFVYP